MLQNLFISRRGRRPGLLSAYQVLEKSPLGAQVALVRASMPTGLSGPTSPVQPEPTFVVEIHLRRPQSIAGWGSWRRGHFHAADSWDLGGIEIFDLETNPILLRPSGFDAVHIYVARRTFDVYAESNGQRVPDSFQCKAGIRDDVILRWTLMLLPHFTGSATLPESVLEDSIMILCAHLMQNYQSSSGAARLAPGGLAIWQRNRAERLLRENVTGGITLSQLAAECNLSTNHFARAFKNSFGIPVHRYLLLKRFEFAKSLLCHSQKSLSSIALEAGFSDQAAFSRSFRAWTGTSPGDWRRRQQHSPGSHRSELAVDTIPKALSNESV